MRQGNDRVTIGRDRILISAAEGCRKPDCRALFVRARAPANQWGSCGCIGRHFRVGAGETLPWNTGSCRCPTTPDWAEQRLRFDPQNLPTECQRGRERKIKVAPDRGQRRRLPATSSLRVIRSWHPTSGGWRGTILVAGFSKSGHGTPCAGASIGAIRMSTGFYL